MKPMGSIILAMGFFLIAPPAQADWTPAKRITWTTGISTWPAIAVDLAGALHVVWEDSTTGGEIYHKKSSDAGANWSAGKRITWTPGYSYHPDIAVDSFGRIHVVWRDDLPGNSEICYKRSIDNGSTWTSGKKLTWTSGFSYSPAIAADSSGNLDLVWHDTTPGNGEVYHKRSTDGGATWTASRRLTWTSGSSSWPAIAVDPSGSLFVAWNNTTPGNEEVYFKMSTNGGTSWTTSQRLSWNSGDSTMPAMAFDSSGSPHVFWQDQTPGNWEIYHKWSTDGGSTWMSGRRLTWTSENSLVPIAALDSSGHIHMVWYEWAPGNSEIYYAKSTDGGGTWSPDERLTWTSAYSYFPDLAVGSPGTIHIVWADNMPGNYEIYYLKSK